MEFLNVIWDYVIPFLFVLTVLVFFHELGHYWIAKRNGVRIEVFSIGFGAEIYGFNDKSGTRWRFSAIPLGGYVKMFGETMTADGEEKELTEEEKKVSFHHKRLGQRAAIVAAGPLANFALTIVLWAGLFAIAGSPILLASIGTVQPESAAAAAQMKPGDRIVAINGKKVVSFDDLREVVSINPGVPLNFSIVRDGRTVQLAATPKRHRVSEKDGAAKEIGLLGVMPDPKQHIFERQNPVTATWMAVERTAVMTWQILSYLGDMIAGNRTAKELGGPLRIAQLSGEVAQGGLINLINFMAVLSLNLGLINLFPIPVLDGGHLAMYGAEAVRGRPLGPKVQDYSFRFGFVLVLALVVFATWNDLVNHLKVIQF
ncbi:MAG: RIP metalloprotease RseP [Rhodospirillales bacterium]